MTKKILKDLLLVVSALMEQTLKSLWRLYQEGKKKLSSNNFGYEYWDIIPTVQSRFMTAMGQSYWDFDRNTSWSSYFVSLTSN